MKTLSIIRITEILSAELVTYLCKYAKLKSKLLTSALVNDKIILARTYTV